MPPFNRLRLLAIGLALSLSSVVAKADVVAVVSSKNPITAMDKGQLADIFLGRSSRFPNGVQAVPIDQAEGVVVRDEFYDQVVGKTTSQMKAYWAKIIFTGRGQPPSSVSNSIEMKKRIADNPDAIGYLDSSLVDDSVRVVILTSAPQSRTAVELDRVPLPEAIGRVRRGGWNDGKSALAMLRAQYQWRP